MTHATHMLGLAQLLEGRELTQEDREALGMVISYCRCYLEGREVIPGAPYDEMYEREYRKTVERLTRELTKVRLEYQLLLDRVA